MITFTNFLLSLLYFTFLVPLSYLYKMTKSKNLNNGTWKDRKSQLAKDIISKEP